MQESVIDKTVVQEPLAGQFAGGVANPLQPGSRIILAESDDLCRKRMQGILEDQGFKVFSVADGFELICRIPEWRPDILMASVDLPRLTGPQVCALLQQCPDYQHLPIFILSHGDRHNQNTAFELANCGADGVLSSPFSTEDLSAILAPSVAE
ncbi:hypothetical protein GCM10011403_04510 [Pseudohongiella nitratireducens]|uniref:Response regulatory domain-containing protein n=1 Tax=Pseudohongiella nitratireducens TaxID=1768907 RepID=A0A917GLM9_9GAMM|nr:response regulator [Pseudohongiella nitratireducens]GGG50460.1 hypothetical protein GCM10011403_04510 [Pseudohongiella nitratireducens]|tara:strand:+ start:4307 stop:4765 length:459 start_codon:yes stop_codon:yes gene_type:complete